MPAITYVREKWSARRLSFKEPWKASREFRVDGPSTPTAALTAVDSITGFAVPKRTDPHDAAPGALFCEGPEIIGNPGTYSWFVRCEYSPAPSGGGTDENLPEVTWEPVEISEPVDSDLDKRPILAASGEPLHGFSRPISYKRLKIVKKFPYFETNLCVQYENATNSRAMSFMGTVPIDVQHIRCAVICPTITYTTRTLLIPIMFLFDVFLDDSLGKYPFQHRALNASSIGWYNDPDTGKKQPARFSDGRGNVFGLDVRLDDTGIPLPGPYGDVKVGDENRTPVTPKKAVNYYQKEIYGDDGSLTPAVNDSTQAVFFYFKRARVVDLSPLTSLL